MLAENKSKMKQVQKELGFTNDGWAKKLGLTKTSLEAIKNNKERTFTLKHVLIAQDLSGHPIQDFFI